MSSEQLTTNARQPGKNGRLGSVKKRFVLVADLLSDVRLTFPQNSLQDMQAAKGSLW